MLDPSRRGRTRPSRGARRIAGSFAGWLLRALSRPLISPALAIFMVDLIVAVVPLVVLAQRNLTAAVGAAVLLNAAHLVDTVFIVSGPHVAALALCVIVALLIFQPPDGVAAPVGRPARGQLSVARPTTTGA